VQGKVLEELLKKDYSLFPTSNDLEVAKHNVRVSVPAFVMCHVRMCLCMCLLSLSLHIHAHMPIHRHGDFIHETPRDPAGGPTSQSWAPASTHTYIHTYIHTYTQDAEKSLKEIHQLVQERNAEHQQHRKKELDAAANAKAEENELLKISDSERMKDASSKNVSSRNEE
jgi:hypothetical protein